MHPRYLLILAFLSFCLLLTLSPASAQDPSPPLASSIPAAWRNAWPINAPLDIEWVGETEFDGVRIKRLRYTGSAPDGHAQRIYAIYAAPVGGTPGTKYPAVLQIHGGGQTCYPANVAWFVKAGYACLAFDWTGPGERPKDETTAWVPPVQHTYSDNIAGAPGNLFIYHAVLAARRAIDVLQQQPEVDPERIGVQGVSWGGLLTWIVAGLEPRLKAAVPVYGAGGLDDDWNDMGIGLRREAPEWVRRWTETFDPRSFSAFQHAPLLLCNGANDFFGQLATSEEALSKVTVPHARSYGVNRMHSLAPQTVRAGMAWFDHYLKNPQTAFPASPELQFECDAQRRLIAYVKADSAKLEHIEVNLARGGRHDLLKAWLTISTRQQADGRWSAELPLVDSTEPIAVIAQAYYAGDFMLSSSRRELVPARDVLLEGQGPIGRTLVTPVISNGRSTSGWYLPRGTDFTHSVTPAYELTTATLEGRAAVTITTPQATPDVHIATRLTADSAVERGNTRALEFWTHDVTSGTVRINFFLRQPGAREFQASFKAGAGWQRVRLSCNDFRPYSEDKEQADPSGAAPENFNEVHQLNFNCKNENAPKARFGIGEVRWSNQP